MNPLVKWLGLRAVKWWLENRPFSKENRAIRKERRRLRRKNRKRREFGLPLLQLPEEPLMDTGFRTSTVATIVGLVTFGLMKALAVFFPEFVAAVPATEEFVAGTAAYIAARFNKTPDDPGAI